MKRNLNNLKKLISDFHNKKCSAYSKEERRQLLNEIIFFENKKEIAPFINEITKEIEFISARSAQLHTAARSYKPGSTFMRARKIKAVLNDPVVQDFWEPPPELTRKFRLNQRGEAVLYVTCDTLTAKRQINPGDIYNLNFYQANQEINVTEFGFPRNEKKTIIKKNIENFIHGLLKTQGKHIYDISNFIAKRYFSLSEDGWVYPSIANEHQGENLCLNAESKKKLCLIGAFAFRDIVPIASYDITDQSAIKTSRPDDVSKIWEKFTQTSNAFGKINATHDSKPIFMIKQIHQLSI